MWLELHLTACNSQRLALICSRAPAFIYRKLLESWNQRKLFPQKLCLNLGSSTEDPLFLLMLVRSKLRAASLRVISLKRSTCFRAFGNISPFSEACMQTFRDVVLASQRMAWGSWAHSDHGHAENIAASGVLAALESNVSNTNCQCPGKSQTETATFILLLIVWSSLNSRLWMALKTVSA